MRSAPAVSLQTADSAAWLWALRGLLGLTLGVTLTWAAARPGLSSATATVFVLAYVIWLAWHTRRPRRWSLDWDGSAWRLGGGADGPNPAIATAIRPANLSVALDFGDALLLRATTADVGMPAQAQPIWRRSIWLPLQRRDHLARWHALRCALYAGCRQP